MAPILAELVDRLRKEHGQRLRSVVLYGSAAADDHHARFSDYNVLCVLDQVAPRELALSEPVFRWWRDQGHPAPLLLSQQELHTSTDCFPIEFHDISAHYQVLHGEDLIAGLDIDDSFYRPQVEHELRAKMLRLRQKAAGVLSDKDLLRKLLADSVSTFCVLFRHALRLAGVEGSMKKREVIVQARDRFGLDPAPFEQLLDLREGKTKFEAIDPVPLLRAYLEQILVVVSAVDSLEK